MMEWASEYELSTAEADAIAAPEWIIKNLIISGHIVLIPAEPNGGKTTIMFHLSGEMVKQGYDVYYVNADISGGDAKPLVDLAKNKGFTLMLPDMKAGKSMDTVLYKLIEMAEDNKKYDNVVFIFDTLKKMLNVISKSAAKRFFGLFRTLSAKGMTIILLAHTNKYKDDEGNPIYEGTGDMRADVDELIYLIPQRHDDKSMTVTTKPDKQRGSFEVISFNIDSNRNVTLLNEPVNTIQANQVASDLKKDQVIIDAINQAILDGSTIQKDIIAYCLQHTAVGERAIRKTLVKYTVDGDLPATSDQNVKIITKIWSKAKGDKNSSIISTIEPVT
ncbi:MAG: AAA family ATPase [Methylophilaceae bacterium]|nr:AAA family ATPase [Methylophilaceae bacterium]